MTKKVIVLAFVFFACISLVQAQSNTESFDAGGIKVIFKPTTKNVIDVRIYFKGGVTNYSADKAGIENIALDAATKCGSQKYSNIAFKDTSDKYGIIINGSSSYDYGFIELNCISKYINVGWNLFSDAVMHPIFTADELRLLKAKAISTYRTNQSSPDNNWFDLQIQNAFNNTPYAINPAGNEETISKFTADDLKSYYKMLLNKNRIFIVVVGNIGKQELQEKIIAAFGNMPTSPYNQVELRAPVWNDNKLLAKKNTLSASYIGVVMNSPEFTSVDYVPFCLGIDGLGGNLYQYLRTNLGASFLNRTDAEVLRMPYCFMECGTTHVQEVAFGMLNVLKSIQQDGLNDEWLQHIKDISITSNYINDQSASAIANKLGRSEVLGNWHYGDDYPQLVKMVTVEQVNRALNNYIGGVRWTFLGSEESFDGVKLPSY